MNCLLGYLALCLLCCCAKAETDPSLPESYEEDLDALQIRYKEWQASSVREEER